MTRKPLTVTDQAHRQDQAYARWARVYDWGVRALPLWKSWLRPALAPIRGPRVLEVSCGTGWLMTRYAGKFDAYGIDLNGAMIATTRRNLARSDLRAVLCWADAVALPFAAGSFDTVVNTMSFSGYPDPDAAMSEIRRVLAPGGRLVLIDINYPTAGNRVGAWLARSWTLAGDQINDLRRLLDDQGFTYTDTEIGGWGSVHLYVAIKPDPTRLDPTRSSPTPDAVNRRARSAVGSPAGPLGCDLPGGGQPRLHLVERTLKAIIDLRVDHPGLSHGRQGRLRLARKRLGLGSEQEPHLFHPCPRLSSHPEYPDPALLLAPSRASRGGRERRTRDQSAAWP